MLLQSKQIKKLFAGRVRIDGFTTSAASSDVVTSELTTALTTAGYNGGSVALTPSTSETTAGVITTGGNNTVLIFDNATGLPVDDGSGNEVFGRLTELGSVYTLSYFSIVSGTETAYTFSSATDIDFEFAYRYEFKDLPTDAILAVKARNINDDVPGALGTLIIVGLTVTGLNTISNITQTGIDLNTVNFYVNGQAIKNGQGISTTTGGSVTVTPATLGYDIETTDIVTASFKFV